MIWVNGYNGLASQLFNLSFKTGKEFWGSNVFAAAKVLKDWNWMFVDPDISFLNRPIDCFNDGYHFAMENERRIKNNILLNGNLLHIVAYGKGIAFAEGISAYLFEEKGIATDFAIFIQGGSKIKCPQSRRAIDCRILVTDDNAENFSKNKILSFRDVVIYESDLKNGFCRYSVTLAGKEFKHKPSNLYFKHTLTRKRLKNIKFNSPFIFWQAVDHAIKIYQQSISYNSTSTIESSKDPMIFETFSMN